MAEITAHLTESALDVNAAIAAASGEACGGVGIFVGTVRESAAVSGNEDKIVERLVYEAHPVIATKRLEAIAGEAATRWGLARVATVHRTGTCELGEPTVVVACGAAHRAEALDACRWMIDTIKSTVPIWKREVYADGSSWVGAETAMETRTGAGR